MTNRWFLKDKDVRDFISNNYDYIDTTSVVDEFNGAVFLRILWWDNISALDQTSITTYLSTKGYTFDHDE